jgi:hypothetical protein
MLIFYADTSQVRKYARLLKRAGPNAMKYASANYLTTLAFEARKQWQADIPGAMTVRSRGTVRRIGVDKARPVAINQQVSAVGHMAAYMKTQESGDSRRKRGKHGIPIPAAAAGTRGPSRRKLGKKNYRSNIDLSQRAPGNGRRQVAIAFSMAHRRGGSQEFFLELAPNRKGIYRITSGGAKRGKMKKVWDLSKSSVTIPENPTMLPAVRKAVKIHSAGAWRKSVAFQLRRSIKAGQWR